MLELGHYTSKCWQNTESLYISVGSPWAMAPEETAAVSWENTVLVQFTDRKRQKTQCFHAKLLSSRPSLILNSAIPKPHGIWDNSFVSCVFGHVASPGLCPPHGRPLHHRDNLKTIPRGQYYHSAETLAQVPVIKIENFVTISSSQEEAATPKRVNRFPHRNQWQQ